MQELKRSFLFADLCGFTAMTEAHGDLDAATIAARFIDAARASLLPGAELLKTIGDAVMIVATNPKTAVEVALALQRRVEEQLDFPSVRIGLNAGACIEREGDFFGSVVNVAARVAAHACAGQILCTAAMLNAAGELGIPLRGCGEASFKNVSQPVALWQILPPDRPVAWGATDPVCRMRVEPLSAPARLSHEGIDYYFCSLSCAKSFADSPPTYLV
jgi:adenylate cyclase